jgi:ribosomal protein S18 acetylase RimI-like enzyme
MATTTTTSILPIVPLLQSPTLDIITQLVAFHQSSILHDRVLMKFHPPFTPAKTAQMTTWWTKRLSTLPSSETHVFLALAPPSNPSPFLVSGAAASEGKVVGIVILSTPESDTQWFVGDVQMLMIDPEFRGRGLAKRLMQVVEDKARELGRTTLTLATTKDCEADLYLYPKLGYEVYGRLPGYGERPPAEDGEGRGELVDGVFYYKVLR